MIQEIKGDIFKVSKDKYIAHCVSGDFTLGAGVAKAIDRKYNMRYQLYCEFPYKPPRYWGYVGEALIVGNIINLVIKPTYKSKVQKKDLQKALVSMRKQCEAAGIKRVCMPRICSGHEHLVWDKVKAIIEKVFDDSDIEIIICVR